MANSWLDGRLVEGKIPLDPSDRGLTLGDGLFETIAVFNRNPAYLEAHLDRLANGAEQLGIEVSRAFIESGVFQLLADHGVPNGILRITITRGSGARGLASPGSHATVLITLLAWQKGTLNAAVRLATSSIRRNEHSPASRLKTLSYMDCILAAREAARAGVDDALLINTAGRIACSTIANVFVVTGPSLLTPPISEGVLPGIIRGRVLGLARAVELAADERPVSIAELMSADAVFLTNSIRLVRPVTAIDGDPAPQSATEQVRRLFAKLCDEIADQSGELDFLEL